MKKKILFAVSLACGVAILSFAADPAGQKAPETDSVRELRTQITQLRAEVDALRQHTKALEATVDELKCPHMQILVNPRSNPAAPSTVIPMPQSSHAPKIWGEREVNGWTYYVVPCEQQSR